MNSSRILMASGFRLWKSACTTVASPASAGRIWKRACTTTVSPVATDVDTFIANAPVVAVAGTMANDVASVSAQKAKVASTKRKMFKKLRSLRETGGTVAMTLNEIMLEEKEEGVSITQADLIRWAKLLDKHREHQHALEWMSRNKMTFSPNEHAVYLDFIAKTKGVEAAEAYFDCLDPNFDNMNLKEKNWPAYQKLWDWHLKACYNTCG